MKLFETKGLYIGTSVYCDGYVAEWEIKCDGDIKVARYNYEFDTPIKTIIKHATGKYIECIKEMVDNLHED